MYAHVALGGVPRYRALQVFTTCTPLSLVAVVMLLVVVLACEQSLSCTLCVQVCTHVDVSAWL